MPRKNSKLRNDLLDAVVETAPLEAYAPQAMVLQGNDYIIRACDGDHEYVYLCTQTKRSGLYDVIEVYPGINVRSTHVRDVDPGETELRVPGRYRAIEEVMNVLHDLILGDLEMEPKQLGAGATAVQVQQPLKLVARLAR